MHINLAKEIKETIGLIKDNGYEAYAVGCYVRDYILSKENYDADITTNAPPEKLKEIFKNFKLEENFMGLGSIKFDYNNYHIEITTYRREYNYVNHRKPSKVEFSDCLKEDLSRRDFTINALCSDGEKMIDLFNGIKDLKEKKIRTIGNPGVWFEEDALRVLRALRFSSKLGFDIEEGAINALNDNSKYLSEIAFETKYKELRGLLEGENYLNTLKKYKSVLMKSFKLSELQIDLFYENMNYEEKEALFFYNSDMKINNRYLIGKEVVFSNDKIDMKNKLKDYGKENIWNTLYFRSTVLKVEKDHFELLNNIINNNECYNLKMLNINGNDLLNINIENNKIGKYLNILLNEVIEDKCINEKKELLKYLKDNILD